MCFGHSTQCYFYTLLFCCSTLFGLYLIAKLPVVQDKFFTSTARAPTQFKPPDYKCLAQVPNRSWTEDCDLITVRWHAGRLGNHMYAYAALYGLAVANNRQPFLRPSNLPYLEAFEGLTVPRFDIKTEGYLPIQNGLEGVFSPHLMGLPCNRKIILTGYMHSYKYFRDVCSEIRQQFKFKDSILGPCRRTLAAARRERNCTVVAGHMRRGGYLKQGNVNFGRAPASKEFLWRAIDYFRAELGDYCVRFLLLGNTRNWTVENAPPTDDVIVPELQSAPVDLCVLSEADHVIISTGTYSWWAGFLNRGTVVFQKDFALRNNSEMFSSNNIEDVYLPNWIGL